MTSSSLAITSHIQVQCQTKVSPFSEVELMKAGRQSPPPEEQNPKQGEEATASGKVGQDKEQFEKSETEEKDATKKTLENLPSNPERKARV